MPALTRLGDRSVLQEFTKLLGGKARIANDTTESKGIDRVVPRDGEDAGAVRHNDVLPLANDRKASLLEGTHGIEVIDTGDFGQNQTATSISRTSSPRS
jgi:hypothetical protein